MSEKILQLFTLFSPLCLHSKSRFLSSIDFELLAFPGQDFSTLGFENSLLSIACKNKETNRTSSAWRFTGMIFVKGCQFSKRFLGNLRRSRFTYTRSFFCTSARVDLKCPYRTKSAQGRNRLGVFPTSAQSDVDCPLRERIGWSYTGVNILRLRANFDSDQEIRLSQITSEERTNVSMDHKTASYSIKPKPLTFTRAGLDWPNRFWQEQPTLP